MKVVIQGPGRFLRRCIVARYDVCCHDTMHGALLNFVGKCKGERAAARLLRQPAAILRGGMDIVQRPEAGGADQGVWRWKNDRLATTRIEIRVCALHTCIGTTDIIHIRKGVDKRCTYDRV